MMPSAALNPRASASPGNALCCMRPVPTRFCCGRSFCAPAALTSPRSPPGVSSRTSAQAALLPLRNLRPGRQPLPLRKRSARPAAAEDAGSRGMPLHNRQRQRSRFGIAGRIGAGESGRVVRARQPDGSATLAPVLLTGAYSACPCRQADRWKKRNNCCPTVVPTFKPCSRQSRARLFSFRHILRNRTAIKKQGQLQLRTH